MPSQPYIIHPTDLQYAPTIMRAPSPSSSIGTEYGPDDTNMVDLELSERDFARKCEDAIGLGKPRPEEDEANRDPLVHPRPLRHKLTPIEEKQMFDQVMVSLRAAVKQLEEEELFEQTAVKPADVVLDDPTPSSEDIDSIMQSLMGLSTSSKADEDPTGTATAQASRFTGRSDTVTPQWGGAMAGLATSTPARRPRG